MGMIIQLLSLVKFFIDAGVSLYHFIIQKEQAKEEENHKEAIQDLQNAQSVQEQEDATKKLSQNP